MYNKRFAGPRRGAPQRGARRPRFNTGENIPHSRFINKTIITEEVVVYVPEHKIADLQVEDIIKKNVITKGYKELTPIQDKAMPHILKGLDVVGIANTGTGKTAAFLIPLIDKVLKDKNVNILIVVPTRELAQQIEVELIDFARGTGIYSVCCVGGAPIGKQIRDLKYRNQFVIGTPGRLKDLIETRHLHLNQFNTIVLDEADRMLDMGFVHDMRYMMDLMPKARHTLFFSATVSNEVEGLIKDFLNNPVRISVKTQDTSKNVHQDIVKVLPGRTKLDLLIDLLRQPDFSKVLIFGRTKHGVEKLSAELIRKGFKSESIHGNKNQGQRQRALDTFKKDHAQILVATDVAARGLDISGVTHVINFDVPATFDDYVHRIGRTGRGDKKGKALTFVE